MLYHTELFPILLGTVEPNEKDEYLISFSNTPFGEKAKQDFIRACKIAGIVAGGGES